MNLIFNHTCLDMREIVNESVQACVTSPPYWNMRDYQEPGQIGLEDTLAEYVEKIVQVGREVRRVLKDDGVFWLNIGDSYFGDSPVRKSAAETFSKSWDKTQTRSRGGTRRSAARREGMKPKDLMQVPQAVSEALRSDGWYLRAEIIWAKPNALPAGRAQDRPARSHEMVYLFAKSKHYKLDRKLLPSGSVWTIPTGHGNGKHFAVFPPDLIRPMVQATTNPGDLVLDPFMGSGTTALVCKEIGRNFVGYEISSAYCTEIQEALAKSVADILKPSPTSNFIPGTPIAADSPTSPESQWQTPQWLVARIRDAFGGTIDLDPCTSAKNPVGARCTITAEQDGLKTPWVGYVSCELEMNIERPTIFVNPPFITAEKWARVCIDESAHRVQPRIIMLGPAAVGTAWFHALMERADDVLLLNKRIRFEGVCMHKIGKDANGKAISCCRDEEAHESGTWDHKFKAGSPTRGTALFAFNDNLRTLTDLGTRVAVIQQAWPVKVTATVTVGGTETLKTLGADFCSVGGGR